MISADSKAKADKTLIQRPQYYYSGYHKEFKIAPGNHALRTQPTDKSVTD